MEIEKIEKEFDADCLTYVGPIVSGIDDSIRDIIEDLAKQEGKRNKLLFILETPGGYAETTRRISDTLRQHYNVVDFLIPSYAMSAGTILAMSGDAIHMDYYSVLGPIDPQIPQPGGNFIPALGYLVRYEDLLKKANNGGISTAEMKILLSFDQGELYSYEQARDLSRSLLEEWLVKYKFKDWTVTETKKRPVTIAMKKQRAKQIAEKLNDVRLWNSRGIGINMDRLRRELNLKIDDFGLNATSSEAVRRYHGLLSDYMTRMSHKSVIHTRLTYEPRM
jgi:membrane-bound ClpP family serine protease